MDELKSQIPLKFFDNVKEANIHSLECLLTCDKLYLQDVTSLSSNEVETIIKAASQIFLRNRLTNAKFVPPWERISTGCESIDKIIRGGIPANGITEVFGCAGVGKTQLCLQLSLMAQLNHNKSKGVIYISTEEAFPSRRLVQLAEVYRSRLHSSFQFEDNVFIDHIADYQQLRNCLYKKVPQFLKVKKIGLIVIDSIAGIFRSENDEISYANRSQDFVTIATQLNKISEAHKVAVVCVNQVTENIDTGNTEPCLGLAWSNLVTCRFGLVRDNNQSEREFQVIFAPDLRDASCRFKISQIGLVNID